MRLFLKFLTYNVFFVLFLFNPAWSANTSYYVDATRGSDSNTGLSHAQAWKTLSKVNRFSFNSGDNVYLLCGETWTGQKIIVDWSGTAQDKVIIGAYYMANGSETIGVNEDGKPIIDGENIFPSNNLSALIKINQNYRYVTIQDIHVKRSNGFGIQAGASSAHITVQRCKVDTSYRANIKFFYSDYGTALYNECSNGATKRQPGDKGWPNGGIGMLGTTNGIMKYNYVYNQYGEGLTSGDNCTIMYNTVVDSMSQGIYLNGAQNSEIAYNMVVGTDDTTYNNPKASGSWKGAGITIGVEPLGSSGTQNCEYNKIHHNIVINTYAGIRMYNPNKVYYVDYIYIYNNTFIDNRYSFHISNTSSRVDHHVYVRNNISYSKHKDSGHVATDGSALTNWKIDYNVWAIKPAPTGIWAGAHDKTGDPNFVKSTWRGSIFTISDFSSSDFFIQAGSSAENSGVDLGSYYAYSLGNGTNFHTTNSDPNMGDPILIFKKSQYDNTLWEIGATKLAGNLGSGGSTLNIQPPNGLTIITTQ